MEKKQLFNTTANPTISALIIAKNEGQMLQACLECLQWCSEIVVLDSGSTDDTAAIAERYGARVVRFKHDSFARLREEVLKHAKSEWVFYVDADERVLPKLAREIRVHAETGEVQVISMRRQNVFFGQTVGFGGWGKEVLTRAFRKDVLTGWSGDIHESPNFTGKNAMVKTPLIHLTHRNTRSGLQKTAEWTWMEAQALHASGVSPVTFWTLLRKGSMEFFRRAVVQQGWKDGMVGIIESIIQAWNRVIVYVQVWELQQTPSLSKKYETIESEILETWKKP